mmetsp:Transcript_1109/g.2607  ORF Transcript_1109/g.2607 Transcript_1109/m.2607 type:complete len:218 (-) Transcript_1109:762-1415(-)
MSFVASNVSNSPTEVFEKPVRFRLRFLLFRILNTPLSVASPLDGFPVASWHLWTRLSSLHYEPSLPLDETAEPAVQDRLDPGLEEDGEHGSGHQLSQEPGGNRRRLPSVPRGTLLRIGTSPVRYHHRRRRKRWWRDESSSSSPPPQDHRGCHRPAMPRTLLGDRRGTQGLWGGGQLAGSARDGTHGSRVRQGRFRPRTNLGAQHRITVVVVVLLLLR